MAYVLAAEHSDEEQREELDSTLSEAASVRTPLADAPVEPSTRTLDIAAYGGQVVVVS